MSQENQVISSTPVQTLPVKRKRGRPRKDESLRRVQKPASENPRSEIVKNNPRRNSSSSNGEDTMLGQVVSGVLDGSFDAGYLVTVKVGETNTVLRGVLFNPSLVLPISEANDVASNVKMLKRHEIPLDVAVQLHGSAQQFEGKSEQEKVLAPLPLKVFSPVKQGYEVAQMSSTEIQSCTPVSLKGVPFDINQVPQVSPQALWQSQIAGGRANDAIQVVYPSSQSTYSQNSLHTRVLQNRGILSFTEAALNDKPGPSIATLQGNGTIGNVPEVQHQVARIEHEPSRAMDGASKGQAVDLNALPVNATADTIQPIASATVKTENQDTVNN